jgi:hypothetical protein
MKNALYKENKNVLSEEGFSRSQSMGKRDGTDKEEEETEIVCQKILLNGRSKW